MTTPEEQADAHARTSAAELKKRIDKADPDTLALLLTEARTHYGWQDRPVSEQKIRELYDIAKMGPTSMNQQPMRLVVVQSDEAKARLLPSLMEGNVPKFESAPATVIIGYDTAFYEKLPELFPLNPGARDMFAGNEAMASINAFRNGTLQGAYFLIAARAIGLDTGPMSGFDNKKVDEEFFADTSIKSNFLCNIGYADETKIFRQLPRLGFEEVVQFV